MEGHCASQIPPAIVLPRTDPTNGRDGPRRSPFVQETQPLIPRNTGHLPKSAGNLPRIDGDVILINKINYL